VVSFKLRSPYTKERTPGTHYTGGWENPPSQASLDLELKRKIPAPVRNKSPAVQIIADHCKLVTPGSRCDNHDDSLIIIIIIIIITTTIKLRILGISRVEF
jgi:hypothetical protein